LSARTALILDIGTFLKCEQIDEASSKGFDLARFAPLRKAFVLPSKN
jgi:hypothetical protein